MEEIYKKDAEELKKAMEGFGTNEDKLIEIATKRNLKGRLEIRKEYKNLYNKELLDDLDSELSGRFKEVMIGLFIDPIEYDVESLHESISGLSRDEESCLEIILSKPVYIFNKIKAKYEEKFETKLDEKIEGFDSKSVVKRIFPYILKKLENNEKEEYDQRKNNYYYNKSIKLDKCKKIAQDLIDSNTKWSEEDNHTFFDFLFTSTPQELSQICRLYYKMSGQKIYDSIDSNFTKDELMKKILKEILYLLISPSEFYATQIKGCMEGLGTNNKKLIRIILNRMDIDMPKIKQYYIQLYHKNIIEDVESDLSGDYQKVIIKLLENKENKAENVIENKEDAENKEEKQSSKSKENKEETENKEEKQSSKSKENKEEAENKEEKQSSKSKENKEEAEKKTDKQSSKSKENKEINKTEDKEQDLEYIEEKEKEDAAKDYNVPDSNNKEL